MDLLQAPSSSTPPTRPACALAAYLIVLVLLLAGLALLHKAPERGAVAAAADLIEVAPTGAGPRPAERAAPAMDLAGPGHDMAVADRDLVAASVGAYER
jgi:hypothetical protein